MVMGGACQKGCKKAEKPTPIDEKALPVDEKPVLEKPAEEIKPEEEKDKLMKEFNLQPNDKLYVEFDTNQGKIKAELFWQDAPITVGNFVGLATGKREWLNPKDGQKSMQPLYNGTIFHRVIKGFMIQGGDPTGTGMGGPGYKFADEFSPKLKHDKKGVLSMANAGPKTNGSQFFITDAPTPHLDNKHSIFGQAIGDESLQVISKIAGVATGPNDKPESPIVLNKVTITKG
jgi:peptidyl-prolyl cis-trans isomerase A (cyclophilin A)